MMKHSKKDMFDFLITQERRQINDIIAGCNMRAAKFGYRFTVWEAATGWLIVALKCWCEENSIVNAQYSILNKIYHGRSTGSTLSLLNTEH